RSWNQLGPDDGKSSANPTDADSARVEQLIRDRLAKKHPPAPLVPVAPAQPVPPSFGDLDALIPPDARIEMQQSWERWAPRLEAALAQGYASFSPAWQGRLVALRDFAWDPAGRRWLIAGLFALAI